MKKESKGIAAALLVAAVALPFLPLAFALAEETFFKSHHVEHFFERIGLHDALGRLYHAVYVLFHGGK